jgi:hypothetical protein
VDDGFFHHIHVLLLRDAGFSITVHALHILLMYVTLINSVILVENCYVPSWQRLF